MELTLTEMHVLADYFDSASSHSFFKTMAAAKGEGDQTSLEDKGIIKDGAIAPEHRAMFEALAKPEIVALFRLSQLEVNMRKRVYKQGARKILVELHREFVMLSHYEEEIESLRVEISNHTGSAFQKHSLLNQTFDGESLLCFAGLADWLRQIALRELINENSDRRLDIDIFADFVTRPLKLGLLSQVMALTHLEVPDKSALQRGLASLMEKGLVEAIEPQIEIGKSTILFGINFLIPNMAITLELYDLTDPARVLVAKEQIIQATPKDNLSLSADVNGYLVESQTASEVINKILAYLSTPSLNSANKN